ncbi:hypothetical protein DMENIID0001_164130 [Sergentomyia squamirostris]
MNLLWGSHFKNLGAAFPEMFATGKFVDVTLACDGRRIHCHRVVLAANSSFFSDLLEENPAQHPIIILPRDVKFWMIQTLVEFMYKGEVTVSEADFQELLNCAQILQIHSFSRAESQIAGRSGKDDVGTTEIFPEKLIDGIKTELPDDEVELDETSVNFQSNVQVILDEYLQGDQRTNFSGDSRAPGMPQCSLSSNSSFNFEASHSSSTSHDQNDPLSTRCYSPPQDFALPRTGHQRSFDEKTMWSAMMGVKNGLPINKASRMYKIPYPTLQQYVKRHGIKSSYPAPVGIKKYHLAKSLKKNE